MRFRHKQNSCRKFSQSLPKQVYPNWIFCPNKVFATEPQNPVASALMAKMNIAPQDRPRVKFECLRLLATLQLAPVRMQLISGFIDTYLRLNASETELFRTEINRISPVEQEVVMRIVTSWIEEGLQQGRQEEAVALIMRLLPRRIGTVEPDLQVRIRQLSLIQLENLAEALLDFSQPADLVNWLDSQEVLRVEICIL